MRFLKQLKLANRSVRGRLIILSLVVALFLFSTTLYIQNLVDRTSEHTLILVSRNQQLQQQVSILSSLVQTAERSSYQYTLLQDRSLQTALAGISNNIIRQVEEVGANPLVQSKGELQRIALDLQNDLRQLHDQIAGLIDVSSELTRLYPGMPTILDELYPLNVEFQNAVEIARAEVRPGTNELQNRLVTILDELRYLWAQQVGAVRVFIANRLGAFGEPKASMEINDNNRRLYSESIAALLNQLDGLRRQGKLELQQEHSVKTMLSVHARYEEAFARMAKIYTSDDWRADLPILKHDLKQLFESIQGNMQTLQSRLHDSMSGSVVDLVITQGLLSYFIWAFSIIAYLIMVGSYLTFEFSVRRPLMQVARALEAYGERGQPVTGIKSETIETDVLVRAFTGMQKQVESRQKRLESVLDNAGEGIITLDDDLRIETFNNAAQYVFGMGMDEVYCKKFTTILGEGDEEKFTELLRSVYDKRAISHDAVALTFNGKRKNGELFPLAMKVSYLRIDGEGHFILMVDDISERQAMMENLRHLAEHDSLTGLYNRQFFMDELEREVSRSHRNAEAKCALLYIDLDNFKFVNDTLGHIAGDRVLIEVTYLINRRMRKGDLLGRLGGDEFGLLLYEVDRERALQTADFYRQQLGEYKFKYEGKVLDVGCSIGVAMLGPEINSKEDLLARADIACHIAKRLGKNRAYIYEENDQENMDSMYADMGWARKIKNAIEDDQFVFACQPILDMQTGDTVSYEVLLRMKDGRKNFVMPAGFLPSAERFGLMLDIDRWIVNRAIEALAELQKVHPGMRYSINLSAKSICDKNILLEIKRLLDAHCLSPELLTFEITEDIAIANITVATAFMHELRSMGCRTALDDFGVGYSSFTYLKELPVDLVKIDGSFVRNAESDPINLAMVKAMNEVVHAMGKKTVAEYVENEKILELLKGLGVDYAQGYHIGRPLIISMHGHDLLVKQQAG